MNYSPLQQDFCAKDRIYYYKMKNNRSYCIVVDADACPVKSEIIQAGKQFGVPVLMVASHDHQLTDEAGVKVQYVDRSDQSADLYISNYLRKGDILITQDFGLAAIGLAKQAIVLSMRGQVYTDRTIDFLLERRHAHAKHRRGGGKHKGPKAMTNEDKMTLLQTLTTILQNLQELRHN